MTSEVVAIEPRQRIQSMVKAIPTLRIYMATSMAAAKRDAGLPGSGLQKMIAPRRTRPPDHPVAWLHILKSPYHPLTCVLYYKGPA